MFKKDFAWGVSTAATQIEGGAYEGGKGLTVWDKFPEKDGATNCGSTAAVACDHFHRYREDVALMKELGVNSYRFSISWARIMPKGTGEVNPEGIKFYNDLIAELKKAGIEPLVTLYHWDMPYELYKQGGWLNPEIVKWFTEYAQVVADNFSDKVSRFITINEPQCVLGNLGGVVPYGNYTNSERLQMMHNIILCHYSAVKVLHAKGVLVGVAPCGDACVPVTDSPEDVSAAKQRYFLVEKGQIWNVSTWSDPFCLGHYPDEYFTVNDKKDIPEGAEDLSAVYEPIDFYCQNIYSAKLIASDGKGGWKQVNYPDGTAKTCMEWYVEPRALYYGPKFLYERYKLPFYMSENGCAVTDLVTPDKKVHDGARVEFLRSYISELKRASDDGVDVRGYFCWSFMDNFEWWSAYSKRFGLVYIDYQTQERIKKDSFYFYQSVVKTNGKNL